ncbi:MAG TPA: hypothetical protein VH601_03530 [Bryobacteraceae bacterium]
MPSSFPHFARTWTIRPPPLCCINPLTAWALTKSSHNLKERDWLLQTAAASSVGKFVLQLAEQYRFKTINVIRRREQEKIIRSLGGN